MTLPPVIRIFFAIELPNDTKEKLARYISSLKKKSKSHGVRWSRPENLHITLQFLPEVKAEHLADMLEKVRHELRKEIHQLALRFGEVYLFPNPYHPRVIVLDVSPQDVLANLSKSIGRGIQAGNYEIENRPFKAHITIGRIKQPRNFDLSFLSGVEKLSDEAVPIQEVVLYRSEPQPEGSQYMVLERIGLETAVLHD